MQVEIKIDETCKETKVIVVSDKMSEEVTGLVKKLSDATPQVILGFYEDSAEIINQAEIYRAYASQGKVYTQTGKKTYTVKQRLYELEEKLDHAQFVRISNSEMINLSKVKNFDLSFSGTICVALTNGTVTYVSRRYVTKIKEVLGI